MELVQVGSLCHDDVIDEAQTRRGVESVNARWGNLKAILAGDFLLAKASEIAAGLGTEVAGLLAATIARLCEGEVHELRTAYDAGRTEASYLAAIEGKTAALFATACRVGGIVGDLPRADIDRLTTFGRHYGMAFQVVDDVLDVVADDATSASPPATTSRRASTTCRCSGRWRREPTTSARCSAARSRAPSWRPPATSCAPRSASRSPSTWRAAYVDQAVEVLAPLGERPSATALAGAAAHLLVELDVLRG